MENKDLERWIAEKVMGWKPVPWFDHSDSVGTVMLPPREMKNWHPTTNIAHAFMVVERMRELGWHWRIDDYGSTKVVCSFSCEFYRMGKEEFHNEEVVHESIGLAICLASKKAIEGGE